MRVFGYGSLVNLATHGHRPAVPTRIAGWRRAWVQTGLRPLAFLTALPDPGTEIEGLALDIADADRAGLSAREAAYDLAQHDGMTVFTIPPGKQGTGGPLPVLLSYLDVVVQGFLEQFGEAGVGRFFATTRGWDAPVIDDRAVPRYPRHQRLSPAERALTDRHLAALGVARVSEG